MPLPGDGFAAVLGLEQAARYDVADQMGLDAFSAETGGASAAVDNESQAVAWTADGSAIAAADGDRGESAVPQWAGGRRQLMATAASTCIGATFTVVPVRGRPVAAALAVRAQMLNHAITRPRRYAACLAVLSSPLHADLVHHLARSLRSRIWLRWRGQALC